MSGERIVVYAGDRNVYPDMLTATKSLLMHNRIDKVYLLIEDDDFPVQLPKCVKTINVSGQKYFPPDSPNVACRFSYMALMRAVLAGVLPDCDMVLSLDIDTIVVDDISELWDLPMDDYYFAAVPEPTCRKGERNQKKRPKFYERQDDYYNAGVVLYNLAKIRADGIMAENIRLLNTEEWYSVEQDTMNIACQGKILAISNEFNSSNWTGNAEKPKIVHYAGIPLAKWRKELLPQEYGEIPLATVMAVNRGLTEKRKNREERVVVYAGTRNLYGDMVTAVKSLLNSTPVDKVYLLIEDDEIPGIPEDLDCVEVLNVSDQPYFPLDSPNAQTLLTYMVLMRGAYHKMFPEHKKVLSLDVDTVVARNISELWDIELTGYYYAAALEPQCSKNGRFEKMSQYFNNGVCLMNLDKLRDGMGDRIIEKINSGKTEAQEQGVFNELCEGKILRLPVAYNSGNPWTGDSAIPKIIHFAGDRNWQKQPILRMYRNMSFSEIMEKQKKWQNT